MLNIFLTCSSVSFVDFEQVMFAEADVSSSGKQSKPKHVQRQQKDGLAI